MRRLLFLSVLIVACAPDAKSPLAPSFSTTADPTVSGAVLGPDGVSNICSSLPASAVVRVQAINLATQGFGAPTQFLACPSNAYTFNLLSSDYLIRTVLQASPAIGSLPVRTVNEIPLDTSNVSHDIVINNGTALGGTASIDGAPLENVDLTLVYGQAPGFLVTFGASDASGHWSEGFRPSLILQNNVSYQTSGGCGALGVLAQQGAPAGSFVFPTDVSAINCTFTAAPAAAFSHTDTRLVVTPMPGDFGGQSPELADRYGVGWGVQFPVTPGTAPAHTPVGATHLFQGGLVIGIAPDRILSGVNIQGQVDCPVNACRDLGLDGTVHYSHGRHLKTVTWRYSDAGSPEAVGLDIVQRSHDGQAPNDYVVFQFDVRNRSAAAVTFYAGTFMDWDVDLDAGDDTGFTDLGGRLMSVTSLAESGIWVGELLLGAPPSGNTFWNFNGVVAVPTSTADQFTALSGGMQQPFIDPGDAHLLHGMGPITIGRNKTATFWIVLLAGDNYAQLLANAAAAQADVAANNHGPAGAAATDGPLTASGAGLKVKQFTKKGALR